MIQRMVKRISRLILLLYCISPALSQDDAASLYELLLLQVQLYQEITSSPEESKTLLTEAQDLAASGDYEIAMVYLEEILAGIPKSNGPTYNRTISPLSISIVSGIDYNRQEFELGYLQADSIIRDEFSKPYIGFSLTYTPSIPVIISNILRYDNENIRDDYRFRWDRGQNLTLQYAGYLNLNTGDNGYSFWAHDLIGNYRLFRNNLYTLYLNNYFYYKNYDSESSGLYDFLRNRLEFSGQWNPFTSYALLFQYYNEIHENMIEEHMDYGQNNVRIGYRKSSPGSFNHWLNLEGIIRNYKFQYLDTLQQNRYRQFNLNAYMTFPVIRNFRFEIEYDATNKLYQDDTTYEPDYLWHFLRPALVTNLTKKLETGIGWEYEKKDHTTTLQEDVLIKEQDYYANGLYLLFNYYSNGGSYISFSGSYQMRRYPFSNPDDLLSIYINRNIYSLYLMAYIPISQKLYLNTFLTYDNDLDIDLDQQNTQSTIFSVEVAYKF